MIKEKLIEMNLPYPGKGDRLVRVYVPEHEEGETLPVVYMTDGQNLFEEETTQFGSWLTHESVKAERAESGKAAIIVGIHNNNPWRNNELTPKSIGKIKGLIMKLAFPAPEGEVFGRFVVEVVKPAVEAKFPVRTGKAATAFCGSSSGGLESFFMAFAYPDLFSYAGVFSPVFLLYSKKNLKRWIHEKIQPEMPFLYFYSGGGQSQERAICKSMQRTYAILEECYPHDMIYKVVKPEALHKEAAWKPIFKDFLHRFLASQE